VAPTSSFVDLGGDSLSYVECSVLLEERLGRLPADWHLRPVSELDALQRHEGPPRLDTTALLRAVGILLVVSTHMHLWYFPGGSHLMLAVVGFNACRFLFSIERPAARATAAARSIARLAVPTIAFVGACMVLVGGYGLPTLALLNGYLGPAAHLDGRWHYWFIEVAVQLLLLATALLAIGPVRRVEQRFPYVFALALFAGTLVLREVWVTDNLRFQLHGVAWFFVLGWLVYRSNTVATKLMTTAVCLLAIPGWFGMPYREWLITGGLVLLLWCREVPMPRLFIRPIATVAAASMAIYVSHFRIWRVLDRNLGRGWAFVATVLAGIAIWLLADRTMRSLRRRLLVGRAAGAREQADGQRHEDRADHRPLDVPAHAVSAQDVEALEDPDDADDGQHRGEDESNQHVRSMAST
jgi:peptidoglycan/LPS O-acetylase OafA/YrhL